jgi:hypothetical protein
MRPAGPGYERDLTLAVEAAHQFLHPEAGNPVLVRLNARRTGSS